MIIDKSTEHKVGRITSEHAFDYDNCVGNHFGEQKAPEALIEEEASFWCRVKSAITYETKKLPKSSRWVSSFSARQSKRLDDFNTERNQSTSSFSFYPNAAAYLDAESDTFLLADAVGNLPDGTSFERATDTRYTETHEEAYFDASKITLLYAKAHRAAARNPDGRALLTVYDDRADILNALYGFFSKHIHLLPSNLELTLCQHEREIYDLHYYPLIEGDASSLGIDDDYQKTTALVGAYIESCRKEDGQSLKVAEILKLDLGRMIQRLRIVSLNKVATEEKIEEMEEDAVAVLLGLKEEPGSKRSAPVTTLGSMIFEKPEEHLKKKKKQEESAHLSLEYAI